MGTGITSRLETRLVSNDKGFTLIELTLVVALIAIVSGMVMPRIMPFVFDDPLKNGSRKLSYFLQHISLLAQQTSQQQVLEYSPRNRTFQLQKQNNEERDVSKDSLQLPDGVSVRNISFYYSENNASQKYKLQFSPKGYLEPCLIYLQNSQGDIMTVKLSPFLGTVAIYDQYIEFTEELFGPFDEDISQFVDE